MTVSLAPLLNADSARPVHPLATGAFALAAVQLTIPSGTKTTLAKSLYRDVFTWRLGPKRRRPARLSRAPSRA
jgi:hypothetical protein